MKKRHVRAQEQRFIQRFNRKPTELEQRGMATHGLEPGEAVTWAAQRGKKLEKRQPAFA